MKRYTDQELLSLLGSLESDWVERKESFKGDVPKKARQVVCAFANDLPNHGKPGITDYRNPNIGDVLKTCGFIQAFGRGLATARREMEKMGTHYLNLKPTLALSCAYYGVKNESTGADLFQQQRWGRQNLIDIPPCMDVHQPSKTYDKWVNRIPNVYREAVLGKESVTTHKQSEDPYCLGTIRHYRSLIPMAQEYRKPIFNLTSADGAIGSHSNAVQDAKKDFKQLAEKIAGQIELQL